MIERLEIILERYNHLCEELLKPEIYEDYKKMGDKLWKSIGRTKEENAYVYRGTYHIVKEKNINPYLLRRYGILIKDFFGDIDEEDV